MKQSRTATITIIGSLILVFVLVIGTVLTAQTASRDTQQGGMNAHLSKPVEPARLFETLENLIGKS